MSRLIDADALSRIVKLAWETSDSKDFEKSVFIAIATAPTIEKRKKGKWTKGSDMPPMKYRNGKPKKFWPYFQYCSNCGHKAFDDSEWGEQLFDWCPYCGADMRG